MKHSMTWRESRYQSYPSLCPIVLSIQIASLVFFCQAQTPSWQASVPRGAAIDLLPDGNLLVMAGKEGVYAVSSKDGQKLWHCSACNRAGSKEWRQIQNLPLWEAGRLLLGPPGVSGDSLRRLYPDWWSRPYLLLNAATGRLIFDAEQERRSWSVVSGRAVLPEQGTLILFGLGPKEPGRFLSTETSILAAYDLRSGSQLWRRPAGEKAALENLQSNLAAFEGRVYFLTNKALYAVEARTGAQLWRVPIVKDFSLRATTGTYVFVDPEKDLVVAFGRGRIVAVQRSSGQPVWSKPVNVPRDNILHAFSTSAGILLFTDDLTPGSPNRPTGRNLLSPPLALLLRYESGENVWGERLKTPGLLAGYIPLTENRLFCLFQRERFWSSGQGRPEDWAAVEIDVLDIQRGQFLFKNPLRLQGALLTAQNVPGGFLVQTARRIQYLSEEGQVLWEKPIRRPFRLPFAVRDEGGVFQAYFIDEGGQLYRWDGPGREPQSIGKPLSAFLSDPAQGIAWEKGKLYVWGGSSLYLLTSEGDILCEFRRPPPAYSPAIRLLGTTISIAGYATSAYLTYKALQTLSYDPEREWDRPDQATSLRQALTAAGYLTGAVATEFIADVSWEAIVKRRQTQIKDIENHAFLLGMNKNSAIFFILDKTTCEVKGQTDLGPLRLFQSLEMEVDPLEKRVYVLDDEQILAFEMPGGVRNPPPLLRALVIRIQGPLESPEQSEEYVEELLFLTRSAGYVVSHALSYSWRRPDPATFLTRGRVEEILGFLRERESEIDFILVDAELSAVQVRNLEKTWNKPVTDREGLILEIFARNARTAQAKAQVELARLEYELPRLAHRWTHLSRERGGIGLRGGGGEQQLETDRRKVRQQIARLRQKVAEFQRQAEIRRERRENLPRVALVGYTNVGKSTLMRLITKSPVLVADRLFATLDTTTRRVVLDGMAFLLSDTVGFIRKLPPTLLEAFHTTLEEVREADLLLLVVDASSPGYLEQIRTVERTLEMIGAAHIPILIVMNKIDRLPPEQKELLEESWRAQSAYPTVFLSATEKYNVEQLHRQIIELLRALPRYQKQIPSTV
ncbi:MAG: GTPase HflX [Bacteroidia bacterium]|nr:GTPase HflX [Bacteroidia bacterium]